MISILIPCHNYLPNKLLQALHLERQKLNFESEILLWDDASSAEFADGIKALSEKFFCEYHRFEENQGRAKIRNKIAEAAKYKKLVFLDCDGLPENFNFLQLYFANISKADVVVGGRSYEKYPPAHSFYLHWKYGAKREVKSAQRRNKKPYFGFQSNNFCVDKQVFLDIAFDENFKGYGHEDTIFGVRLKAKGKSLVHIENPVVHLGLQRRSVFLEKSIEAAEQLANFVNEGRLDVKDASMAKAYKFLKKVRLWRFFMLLVSMRMPYIHRKLMKKKNPGLFHLDIYRLFFFGCNMP